MNTLRPVALSVFLSLFLLAASHPIDAQPEWQRSDGSIDSSVTGLYGRNSTVAPDGTPLFFLHDGIHRLNDATGLVELVLDAQIDDAFVAPTSVVAFTHDAVLRSDESGRNWRVIRSGRNVGEYYVTPVFGTFFYLFNQESKEIRRVDLEGNLGEARQSGPINGDLIATPSGILIQSFARTGKPDTLLHFRSVDQGVTWDTVFAEIPLKDSNRVHPIVALSDEIFIRRLDSLGLLISKNGGTTWHHARVDERLRYFAPPTELGPNGTVWCAAGADTNGIFSLYRSIDTGTTWEICHRSTVSVRLGRNGRLYGVSNDRLVEFSECGGEARTISHQFRNLDVQTLFRNDGGIYAAVASGTRLYRSTDNGRSWEELHSGVRQIAHLSPYPFADSAGGIYITIDTIIETRSHHRLYRSSDGGTEWTRIVEDVDRLDYFHELRSTSDGIILLIYGSEPDQDLRYSIDSGRTFTQFTAWPSDGTFRPFSYELLSDGRLVAVGNRWTPEGQYRDFGMMRYDLIEQREEWLGGPDANWLKVGATGRLYAWHNERLFRSDDNGETFRQIPLRPDMVSPEPHEPFDTDLLIINGSKFEDRRLVSTVPYVSRDGGQSWDTLRFIPVLRSEDGTTIALHREYGPVDGPSPNLISDTRVLRSYDDARFWSFVGLPLLEDNTVTASLLLDDGTLLVGTARNGLWRLEQSLGVDGEIEWRVERLDLR